MKETGMKTAQARRMARAAFALVMMTGSPAAFGQSAPGARDEGEAILRTERQQRIQQVLGDKAGYAAGIVARWEGSAREAGRWDRNYSVDLLESLMKLDSEHLLAAGDASSYPAMMTALATGQAEPTSQGLVPNSLGQSVQDLVRSFPSCRVAAATSPSSASRPRTWSWTCSVTSRRPAPPGSTA